MHSLFYKILEKEKYTLRAYRYLCVHFVTCVLKVS